MIHISELWNGITSNVILILDFEVIMKIKSMNSNGLKLSKFVYCTDRNKGVMKLADKITIEQRSSNMKAIKSVSKLENKVSRALREKGIRFRKNTKLFGKPDIAIQIAIFIDSCFWHLCPIHYNMPKSNWNYWIKKLTRNKERDKEVNDYYKENG